MVEFVRADAAAECEQRETQDDRFHCSASSVLV